MMKSSLRILGLVIVLSIYSCHTTKNSLKVVDFKTPVNTLTKKINLPEKKVYELEELGVYASNKFDGARLNDFKKLNDSTAIVYIKPENEPINNSAYYAFKTWSKEPKDVYFKFEYPKNYKHRYIPKLKINNEWSIMDTLHVFKNGEDVTIKLSLTPTPTTIAAQEIQTSTDVKKWYTSLIAGKESFVRLNSVGNINSWKNAPCFRYL